MPRIIAGRAGGRRIAAPAGAGTRPTTDRTREAIFGRLDHLDVLEGGYVVDLYAGSGALGLEAVSRGASGALLVESHKPTAAIARRNAADVGLPDVTVRQEPVERVVAAAPLRPASVVLVDPPYDLGEAPLAEVLDGLVTNGWLVPGGIVVVERSTRTPEPSWPAGLERIADKRYGETAVWYAERVPADDSADVATVGE